MQPGGMVGGETAWRREEGGVRSEEIGERSVGADARIGPRHTGTSRVVIKRQKPLRPRFTRPPPRCARRLSRGHSPRKMAPHNVGSWPSLRGLRGFCRFITTRDVPVCRGPMRASAPTRLTLLSPLSSLLSPPCGFAAHHAARLHKMRKNKRLA